MNLFSCGKKQYFTHSLRSFVKCCFYHLKIKFTSSRRGVISSIHVLLPCLTAAEIYGKCNLKGMFFVGIKAYRNSLP